MTKCLAKWNKESFGKSLDRECHGCTRMHKLIDPVSASVQQPPQFSDKCPDREPIPTYPNYHPRFRQ